jgi:hypothetical protein
MDNRKPPTRNTTPTTSNDPYVYASIVDTFVGERNPFQILIGELTRTIQMTLNLRKTRRQAQARVDHLQSQVDKVESLIAEVNPQPNGTRINKLR